MRKDLVQLTETITDGDRHGEICWGADVGKELLARDSDERWYGKIKLMPCQRPCCGRQRPR